jgi:hypothetical protein
MSRKAVTANVTEYRDGKNAVRRAALHRIARVTHGLPPALRSKQKYGQASR